jgi:hypothetical protein
MLASHALLSRVAVLATAFMGVVALAMMSLPAGARGDGDPASDVLVSQPLFLPADANVPAKVQARLGALLSAAQRARFPVRVALISSPADMGSVTGLWRQPETYARFLGQELSLAYSGRVLVVMPSGLGLSAGGRAVPEGQNVLAAPSATPGGGLAQAAITSVLRLAAQAGHPLQVPGGAAASVTGAGSASSDIVAWIVFVAGGVVVALAWAASFRARPLRIRRAPG